MLLSISSPSRPTSQLHLQAIQPSGLLHLYRRGPAPLLTRALPTAGSLHNQRNPSPRGFRFGRSSLRVRINYSSNRACFHSLQRPISDTMSPPDRDVLPNTVKPINYNIELFDLELGGGFTFNGAVTIEIDIRATVQEITLNAHELEVTSAAIDGRNVHGMSHRTSVHPVWLILFSKRNIVRQKVPAGNPGPSREGRPLEGDSVHQIQRYHEQHHEWLLQIQV